MSEGAQNEIVVELTENPAALDDDDWQEKYGQLDVEHQEQVDEALNDYSDDAVG